MLGTSSIPLSPSKKRKGRSVSHIPITVLEAYPLRKHIPTCCKSHRKPVSTASPGTAPPLTIKTGHTNAPINIGGGGGGGMGLNTFGSQGNLIMNFGSKPSTPSSASASSATTRSKRESSNLTGLGGFTRSKTDIFGALSARSSRSDLHRSKSELTRHTIQQQQQGGDDVEYSSEQTHQDGGGGG
ncbi:hypothetical protein HK102_012291, partial [Quaeritorhiza haematococci]